MNDKDADQALCTAFAAAFAEMGPLFKNSQNPHLRNRYADLAAVMDVLSGPMANHGLAMYQSCTSAEGALVLETTVVHRLGGRIRTQMPVAWTKGQKGVNDAQTLGAALTYSRRYAAMAMWNLAPEDDDGNSAGPRRRAEPPPQHHHRQTDTTSASRPQSDDGGWQSFCRGLGAIGSSVNEASAMATRHGASGKTPHEMDNEQRIGLLSWMGSADGVAKLTALRAEALPE